jgi:hypothetical protein
MESCSVRDAAIKLQTYLFTSLMCL